MRTLRAVLRGLGLAGLALLAACVHPTYYEPASDGQGYTDQEIADGRYRVTFSGNSATPRETVDNYLLYRAAEITLNSGHDYFVMTDHDVERSVTYRSYVDVPPGGGLYGPNYAWGPYWDGFPYGPYYDPYGPGYAEVTSHPVEKYQAFATIAVYDGSPPADNPDAYSARDVIARLKATIQRPDSPPKE